MALTASKAEKETTRTLSRARNKRGFTLIELSVVIIVLALIAATVLPRLSTLESSREYRDFRLAVRRLGLEAREQAISRGLPTSVTFDESEQTLNIVIDSDGEETTLRTVEVVEGVEPARFAADNAETNASEWKLTFYPDGRSDGGGIDFESNGDLFTLYAEKSGSVHFADGEMPDLTSEQWPAGEYEHRI
jgi:prepilin-type N-terminal cleavage/methylation domain-containing protein